MVYWYIDWYLLTDALLPFMLIFTVIYAILRRSKILGEGKNNFNGVVSLVIALLVIIPHISGTYPYDRDVVQIINSAIPNISIFIILILMGLLLVGIWGVELNWVGGTVTGLIALVSFIIVVYVFGAAANLWELYPWLWWLSDPNTQSLILIILVFAILVYFITKEPGKTKGEGFFKAFGDLFKGAK